MSLATHLYLQPLHGRPLLVQLARVLILLGTVAEAGATRRLSLIDGQLSRHERLRLTVAMRVTRSFSVHCVALLHVEERAARIGGHHLAVSLILIDRCVVLLTVLVVLITGSIAQRVSRAVIDCAARNLARHIARAPLLLLCVEDDLLQLSAAHNPIHLIFLPLHLTQFVFYVVRQLLLF